MPDELAVIRRVIAEHTTIREHIKLMGDSVNDQEALSSLRKASADWIPGRLDILVERQGSLLATMSALEEGLNRHYTFEELSLPPLLGELIMGALIQEHRELSAALVQAKSTVSNTRLEGLSREELLSQESGLQDMIRSLSQKKTEHLAREEAVLFMVERALLEREHVTGK